MSPEQEPVAGLRYVVTGPDNRVLSDRAEGHDEAVALKKRWTMAFGFEPDSIRIEPLGAPRLDSERLLALLDALAAYRADPVNAYDKPSSWAAHDALLDAADDVLRAPTKETTDE